MSTLKHDGSSAPEVVQQNYPELSPSERPEYADLIPAEPYHPYRDQYADHNNLANGDKEAYELKRDWADSPAHSKICGLRRRTFWILLVLILIIVAGAVGGGVGGALGSNKKSTTSTPSSPDNSHATSMTSTSSSTSSGTITSTSTSTSSSPAQTSTTTFSSGCNTTDQSIYTPTSGNGGTSDVYSINGTTLSYRIFCDTNFASAASGSNPEIGSIPGVQPMYGLTTLQDCITLCAETSQQLYGLQKNVSWGNLCSGVVYANTSPKSTCWLQNGMTANASNVGFENTIEHDSAVLLWNH